MVGFTIMSGREATQQLGVAELVNKVRI